MRDASLIEVATLHRAERYRVELLANARTCDEGVEHGDPGSPSLLPWGVVVRGLAAEIGEPEGVLTVIFDLVVASDDSGYSVRRFDAEPGEDAARVGSTLMARLGSGAVSPSIKALATEGRPDAWYPDLDEFEAAALTALSEG
jgi:hypothetical protein